MQINVADCATYSPYLQPDDMCEIGVYLHPVWMLLLDGMSDKPHATAALPLVKGPPVPIE